MFELMIMLSRLIFIFLIAYFILLGLLYIGSERDFLGYNRASAVLHQRFVIIATNLLAFIILSYNPASFEYDFAIVSIGAAFLIVYIYSAVVLSFVYKDSCPLIWNCVFYLLSVGVIMLTRLDASLAQRQIVWIFLGVNAALFIPAFFRYFRNLDRFAYLYLAFSWLFVTLPFFFGKSMYGSVNWVALFGFTFQPSEIAKIFYIFYLASVFAEKPNVRRMIFPTAMAGGIVICLVAQRDFGAALIFFMTYLVIVYISTGSIVLFGAGIGFASVAAVLSYSFMSHIQRRVAAWLNPWGDISDTGYQIAQSLFAIGTWGALGAGLTRGYPHTIPVVYTDFIFSAICEEFGVIFGIMLIAVLLLLMFRGIISALRNVCQFFSLLAAAITSILAFQSFLILGGVIKLIPLTGVTLPFVSYGGSSVTVSILMAGLLAQLSKSIPVGMAEGYENVEG